MRRLRRASAMIGAAALLALAVGACASEPPGPEAGDEGAGDVAVDMAGESDATDLDDAAADFPGEETADGADPEGDALDDVADSGPSPGYTLFAPMPSTNTYLIDNDGQMVHRWESPYEPGQSAYLLEDGALLRAANPARGEPGRFSIAGGAGGRIERYSWEGELLWAYDHISETTRQHHDIEPMPNGNVLFIAWEYKSAEEARAAGRTTVGPRGMWPDVVLEVEPEGTSGGRIVWEWHVWDHLGDGPGRIDVNLGELPDWNHMNSVDYEPDRDEVLVSVRSFNEIWVIDHSTTTAEAAGSTGGRSGHGGDLVYRWGNPAAYGGGGAADQRLFVQHDARWLDPGLPGAGHILVFNNGKARPDGTYTTIDEIDVPRDPDGRYFLDGGRYGPEEPAWRYVASVPESFYVGAIGSSQRLPNGNTLICAGDVGELFEVTAEGSRVWEFTNPVMGPRGGNNVFRADRYDPEFPGLAGRSLVPLGPVL